MATLKELHELIHSLSKSEKKHISMMMSTFSGKGKDRYINTFKSILKVKEVDLYKAKESLANGVNGMNLSEANNNVYDFICRCLIGNFSSSKLGFPNELILIENLLNRKLFATAHKRLQMIIPQIEEMGSFALLLRSLELQEAITINYPPINTDLEFRVNFINKRQIAVINAKQNIDFGELLFKFFQLVKSVGEPRNSDDKEKYLKLWKDPLMQLPESKVHFRNIKMYYTLKNTLMSALNIPNAVEHLREDIKNYRARFSSRNLAAGEADLIDALLSLMAYSDEIDWNELEQIESRLIELEKEITLLTHHYRMRTKIIIIKLLYFIKREQYEDGVTYFETTMKSGEHEKWKEAPLSYMAIFMGARLYFLQNDIEKSLDTLLLIQQSENQMRSYFLMSYQFLKMFCHHKLNNFSVLESQISSISRGLRKLNKLYEPEKAVLAFLTHSNDINKFETNLKKLSSILEPLYNDPYHRVFFEFGDFKKWLSLS